MLFSTPRGAELREYEKDSQEWRGHGSLAWYYGIASSSFKHKECSDFSSPSNFPEEIVTAIKEGKFRRGFGCPEGLLSTPALEEYKKIEAPAREEYNKIKAVEDLWKEL